MLRLRFGWQMLLIAGGLSVIGITFRAAVAPEVIHLLSREGPQLFPGAGAALTRKSIQTAKSSGVRFAIAPVLNP